MGFFSKKNDNQGAKPAPAPMGAPGAMPPPPGAPRPMGPGPMPAPAPMGAPRPMGAPGAMPPPPGAPRPMGPGPMPAPAPMGAPSPMAPPSPSFGPSQPSGGFSSPRPSFAGSSESMRTVEGSSLDNILMSKKGYVTPKSVLSGSKTTYDQFCNELSYDYLDNLLKSPNLLDQKSTILKIKKTLVFALTNTKDLPDNEREVLFAATLRFVDFLKGVVYYPEKEKINDDIITFLPFLKDTAYAFRSFLLKNR